MKQEDLYFVLNREISSPTDWVHLAPFGEFKGFAIGAGNSKIPVVQVLNAETLGRVARNSSVPILVDFEHRSADPDGDTTAAAWILNFELRDDGLYGQFDWSDLGRQAVENKRYRFLSPEFGVTRAVKAGDRVEPVLMPAAGLTNKPNLKGLRPLRNRGAQDTPDVTNGGTHMKGLLKLLGLQEDAEEASVLSAVQAIKNRADEADALKLRAEKAESDLATVQNRVTELESIELGREADAFIETNAAKIKNKETVREQYIRNKESTIALFESVNEPEKAPQRVLNRKDTSTPKDGDDEAVTLRNQRDEYVDQLVRNKGMTRSAAWAHGTVMRPELFKS